MGPFPSPIFSRSFQVLDAAGLPFEAAIGHRVIRAADGQPRRAEEKRREPLEGYVGSARAIFLGGAHLSILEPRVPQQRGSIFI